VKYNYFTVTMEERQGLAPHPNIPYEQLIMRLLIGKGLECEGICSQKLKGSVECHETVYDGCFHYRQAIPEEISENTGD